MRTHAIVLAAGRGRRMGGDKALLELEGATAVQRVVDACAGGGCASITVVRRAADAALPHGVLQRASLVRLNHAGEMIDSVRAGVLALPEEAAALLVFPVDYALVDGAVVAAVLAALAGPARIALPLWQGRPGHPVALAARLAPEILDPTTASLRDVVARDPARVAAVPVDSPWVLRDLDTVEDLAAARAWLGERSP